MPIIVDIKVKHLLILLVTGLTRWQHLKGDVHLRFVRNEQLLFLFEMDRKCVVFSDMSWVLLGACWLWDLAERIVNEGKRMRIQNEEEEESRRMRPDREKSAPSFTAIHPAYQQWQERSEKCFDDWIHLNIHLVPCTVCQWQVLYSKFFFIQTYLHSPIRWVQGQSFIITIYIVHLHLYYKHMEWQKLHVIIIYP